MYLHLYCVFILCVPSFLPAPAAYVLSVQYISGFTPKSLAPPTASHPLYFVHVT